MKKLLIVAALFTFLSFANSEEKKSEKEPDLKSVIVEHLKANQEESVPGVLKTLHPESDLFKSSKENLSHIFKIYDLKYELISYKYLTKDEDYAYCRIKWKRSKVKGPEIRDCILDIVQVYKLEGDTWKIYNQTVLKTKFLGPEIKSPHGKMNPHHGSMGSSHGKKENPHKFLRNPHNKK